MTEAYKYFPEVSHVLIADPDWRPDISTMRKDDLDLSADVFRFLSYDRNNVTTRRMDWILRQKPGLKMRYHLHEVLDIGRYTVKNIPWVIHEIEKVINIFPLDVIIYIDPSFHIFAAGKLACDSRSWAFHECKKI